MPKFTPEQLADREAITDLIYRYCRAMDRIDAELGYTIWHADGIADYGKEVFQGKGRDFIDHVCAQHRRTLMHSHQVTNIIIELDGNTAASESYVTATLRIQHGDELKQISNWGRYADSWSCRNGIWGIDKRIAIRDFDEIRTITPLSQNDRARRDRGDPTYTILKT